MAPHPHLRGSFPERFAAETPSASGKRFSNLRAYILAAILVLTVVLLLWVRHSKLEQERALELRNELQQLRNAVLIYVTRFGSFPPDISTLTGTSLSFAGSERQSILEGMTFDDEGRMVDPYGYPYVYDKASGTVYSSAPCCKNW